MIKRAANNKVLVSFRFSDGTEEMNNEVTLLSDQVGPISKTVYYNGDTDDSADFFVDFVYILEGDHWDKVQDIWDSGSLSVSSKSCMAGYFLVAGTDSCQTCLPNTYKAAESGDPCTSCPSGTSTEGNHGSTSSSACLPPKPKVESTISIDGLDDLITKKTYPGVRETK